MVSLLTVMESSSVGENCALVQFKSLIVLVLVEPVFAVVAPEFGDIGSKSKTTLARGTMHTIVACVSRTVDQH